MPRTPIRQPYKWLAQYYDQIFPSFRSPIDAARRHADLGAGGDRL
jgi:hypothetical protein